MFLHNLKYELLSNIRMKDFIFWMMCFPIALGTFFYLGFGKVYNNEIVFSKIPVAVVEVNEDEVFNTTVKSIEAEKDPLFSFTYTDKAEAEKLLKEGDVEGIITVDDDLSLTFFKSEIDQTIIKSFVEQFVSQKAVITDIAMNAPEKLPEVTAKLNAVPDAIENKSPSGGNMNPYDSYFQNLLTMTALFGMITGVLCATRNQGNLSAIGARKCISPNYGLVRLISSLTAAFITQIISVIAATTFVLFILKINLGDNIAMVYLSGAIGAFVGISIGFFIGAIGRSSERTKGAVSTTVMMFLCFLSGLMIGDIKAEVEEKFPIINRINPAALTCDLFYCLTLYDDYRRYTGSAVILLIISVVFITGGFLLTRRKIYENL